MESKDTPTSNETNWSKLSIWLKSVEVRFSSRLVLTDAEVLEVATLVDRLRYLINLHPAKTYEMMKALGEPFRELTELGEAKL